MTQFQYRAHLKSCDIFSTRTHTTLLWILTLSVLLINGCVSNSSGCKNVADIKFCMDPAVPGIWLKDYQTPNTPKQADKIHLPPIDGLQILPTGKARLLGINPNTGTLEVVKGSESNIIAACDGLLIRAFHSWVSGLQYTCHNYFSSADGLTLIKTTNKIREQYFRRKIGETISKPVNVKYEMRFEDHLTWSPTAVSRQPQYAVVLTKK